MASTALPYRQLSRLNTELFVSFDEASLRQFPNRFAEAVVFLVVARTCAADWLTGRAVRTPAAPLRSITVNAIATSLFCSVETTRRHVMWLVDQGFLVRTGTGFAVSPAPDNASRMAAYLTAYHDLFLRLVAEIDETCVAVFDASEDMARPVDAIEVIERAMDVALVPLNTDRALARDVVALLVWITISAANIRHVTYDPELSRRYAIDSSPDALRRPTSLHAVSSAIGLPYATAWRKARALEAAGLLAQGPDGWVVLTEHLRSDEVEASVTATTNYIIRKIRELMKLGLRPNDLRDAWLNGRPAHTRLSGSEAASAA